MAPPKGGTRSSLVDAQGRPLVIPGSLLPASVSNADFGPGQPITPVVEEPVRVWDFPVGVNTRITPRPSLPFSFASLRAFANVEPVRLAIETRKDQIERLDWKVKAVDEKAAKKDASAAGRIAKVTKLLRKPDGFTPFATWLRPAMEDLLAIDAPAFEKRRNRGGELIGLDVIPGDTIKVLVDETGRLPRPPYPAYQQIIKGRVWADLTTDELLYSPRNKRPNHVLGFSPVEQIIVTVQTVINRQAGQLAYFTEGNTPAGFLTGPDGWQPAQIKEMQTWLDGILSGNIADRQKALFLPHGTTWNPFKQPPLKDEFDEWLYRIVSFAFSLPPTPFIKQMNRSTSDNDADRAEEEGLEPLKLWASRVLTGVIQDDLGEEDLEFAWVETPSIDPKIQAEIDDKNLRNASTTLDEVRDGRGQDPLPDGQGAKPMLYTSNGAVTLEEVLKASEDALNPPAPPLATNETPPPGQTQAAQPAPRDGSGAGATAPPSKAEKLAKAGLITADRAKARRHTVALRKAIGSVFAKAADEVSATVAMKLRGLGKAADDAGTSKELADRIAKAVSLQPLDDIAEVAYDDLFEVVYDSAELSLASVGATATDELTNQVFERAAAWAKSRAAELVSLQGPDNIVEPTRDMIRTVIADGLEQNLGAEKIADAVQASTAFSEERAELIARTEIGNSNSQGSLLGLKSARDVGVAVKKGWAVAGGDCCDICQANEDAGLIDVDDDFPSGDDAPLAHPRCLPGDVLVATGGGLLGATKRLYDGNLLVIRTAGGKELSCTPNHPILTDRGWVAARSLHVGSHVISDLGREWVAPGFDLEHKYVPARIEDVAEALGRAEQVTAAPVPITPEDFHGDGGGSEIAVVWANRLLLDRVDSTLGEQSSQLDLVGTDMQGALLDGGRVLELGTDLDGLTADRGLGGRGSRGSILGAHARVAHDLGLSVAADGNASTKQSPTHHASVNAEALGDGLFSLAGDVATDEIVHIESRVFRGHVFNLQTTTGWYVANGIITHNCECVVFGSADDEDEG